MSERDKDNPNLNGLLTAILYLGLFAFAGCLALFVFLLAMTAFLWLWMRICDWSGLSHTIPSHGERVGLGVVVFLGISVPICAILWRKSNRPSK